MLNKIDKTKELMNSDPLFESTIDNISEILLIAIKRQKEEEDIEEQNMQNILRKDMIYTKVE